MILRPRQKIATEKAVNALQEHGNTLTVAPTGAGKTIILSAVTGQIAMGKALILQHREELVNQNISKFKKINTNADVGLYTSNVKSWYCDYTFGMVQTLCRENNLRTLPHLDMITIDEAHHVAAESYAKIIARAKEINNQCKIYGVTATPNRGDKKGLRHWFSNCSDQITIYELIKSGHLVKPKTFVCDVGIQDELSHVKRRANDFDMDEVAKIFNHPEINKKVVEKWQELAENRKTVIFCSTVAHAQAVTETFKEAGIITECIHGEMSIPERTEILNRYDRQEIKVIVNVAVLTEGWDNQPTACIVLLRPSSFKSTFIQMVGRGLRTVDPSLYPGIHKHDCIILDFGISSILHGTIEQQVNLDGWDKKKEGENGEAPTKECPDCKAELATRIRICPFCGYEFNMDLDGKGEQIAFEMREIDLLLGRSNFQWIDLFGDGYSWMSTGFNAWAGVFLNPSNNEWYAIGQVQKQPLQTLSIGEKLVAMASGDDFLNCNEDDNTAHKSKNWLKLPPTDKQLQILGINNMDFNKNRYQTTCLINWKFKHRAIRNLILRG